MAMATDAKSESFMLKAAIAGGVCASVSASLNGFDVTKIRMQNQCIYNKKYTGVLDGLKKIFQEEGINGLTKGIYPSMLREISYSSIRMGGYEPVRKALAVYNGGDPHYSSPFLKFFAALITGGVGSALCNPFDLVKTSFQALLPGETARFHNTRAALIGIYNENGFKGLYKGWAATSARAAVLTSAQLGSYDSIKNNLMIRHFNFEEGFFLHLAASMTAGIITATATNPFDVIKTRYLSDSTGKFKSLPDCVIQLYQKEGFCGFFKGWVPSYWRLGPHTVMSLLLIEEIRKLCGLSTL